MKIEASSGRGNFKILHGNWSRLELKYEGWFGSKAATRYQGQEIRIESAGFWGQKFNILKNKQEIGGISFDWKGKVVLRVEDTDGVEHQFILKAKGGFKLRFEIYNEAEELLLTMRASYNWKKWGHNYDIERTEVPLPIDEYELLMYLGFAANAYVSRQAAG